jgi:hypothetical protein
MTVVVDIINTFFALLFYPLRYVPPVWGLIVISLLTGLVMLMVFRFTSNQTAIKAVRDKISGHILEIRLYKDSPRVIILAMGKILRYNLTYLRYALIPLLVVIIPVMLIVVQLNYRYAYRPYVVGESFVVKVRLPEGNLDSDLRPTLMVPVGLRIETPSLYIHNQDEVDWRVGTRAEGKHELLVQLGTKQVRKSLQVGRGLGLLSPSRAAKTFLGFLLSPAEQPLPSGSPIQSIEVNYPKRALSIFGLHIHWLVLFIVLSVLFGFAVKRPLGVEI